MPSRLEESEAGGEGRVQDELSKETQLYKSSGKKKEWHERDSAGAIMGGMQSAGSKGPDHLELSQLGVWLLS